MDEKIRRLGEWATGGAAAPFTLDINPTDKCNLRCLHCWQRNYRSIDSRYELSDEKIIEKTKEGVKLGVREFEITGGGEPMMRKGLVLELMKIIKKNERFGNVTTNGTLFTPKDMKGVVKIGWDRITFSIDGPSPDVNDYLRGKGSFERIMNSINLLNDWKRRLKKKFPVIKFNVVVYKKNYDKTCEMIELAKNVGCELVHFDSLTVHPKFGKKLKLNKKQGEEFETCALRANELSKKYKIWTDVNELSGKFLEKSNRMVEILSGEGDGHGFLSIPCYEPWWHLVIKVDGSGQPCCLYDSKEENVKEKSLKEIWFGEFFNKIRNEMVERKFSSFCSICNVGQVMENRRIREELGRAVGGQKWTKGPKDC